MEDTFRQLYHEALVQQNIDPESIRKLEILDEQGDVVEPGGVTDIDIFARDSECAAIEIKATIDQHDIRRFEKTIKLAEEQEGIKVTSSIYCTSVGVFCNVAVICLISNFLLSCPKNQIGCLIDSDHRSFVNVLDAPASRLLTSTRSKDNSSLLEAAILPSISIRGFDFCK